MWGSKKLLCHFFIWWPSLNYDNFQSFPGGVTKCPPGGPKTVQIRLADFKSLLLFAGGSSFFFFFYHQKQRKREKKHLNRHQHVSHRQAASCPTPHNGSKMSSIFLIWFQMRESRRLEGALQNRRDTQKDVSVEQKCQFFCKCWSGFTQNIEHQQRFAWPHLFSHTAGTEIFASE